MELASPDNQKSNFLLPQLPETDLAIFEEFGGEGFVRQLRDLGFTPQQVLATLQILVYMKKQNPSFFAQKLPSVVASALAYASYFYLKKTGLTDTKVNQRLVARLTPGIPVDPESISHVYRKILRDFRDYFPFFLGGSWNRHSLQNLAHKHRWITKGLAYEELQLLTNEEFRIKHHVNWSDKRIDLYRRLEEQHCQFCNRSRRYVNYNNYGESRWKDSSCPNERCDDFGVKGKGNLRLVKFYGKKGVALIQCTTCKETFSDTLGTIFYDMRIDLEKFHSILRMISDGKPVMLVASETRSTRRTVRRILGLAKLNPDTFKQVLAVGMSLSEHQIENFWNHVNANVE